MSKLNTALKKIIEKRPGLINLLTLASIFLLFVRNWLSPQPQYGGDWHYIFTKRIIENLHLPNLWSFAENLGSSNAGKVGLNMLDALQSYLYDLFGFEFKQSEIILWFAPYLFFSTVGMYLLSQKFFKSKLATSIAVFFYTFNTYTLTIFSDAGHSNILVSYSLLPFVLVSLFNLFEKPNLSKAIIYVLFFSLTFIYDFRIGYIGSFIQAIFIIRELIFNRKNKYWVDNIIWLYISMAMFIIVNVFWILPIIITPKDSILLEGYDKAIWVYRLSFQTIFNGIFPQHPFWGGDGVSYFVTNPISPIFVILTILLVIGIVITARSATKSVKGNVILLTVLWIAGSIMISGSNFPFGSIYIWLFEHFPGFFMFREPQKFYILVLLPYSLLLGYSINAIFIYLKKQEAVLPQVFKYVVLIILTFSIFPAFQGLLNNNAVNRDIPPYANKIAELNDSTDEFYRVLWIPQLSKASYQTESHPRLDYESNFKTFFGPNEDIDTMIDFIGKDEFEYFLQKTSSKYVVITEESEISKWYKAEQYERILKYLDSAKFLTKLDATDVNIYEYKKYDTLIYATDNAMLTNYNFLNETPLNKFNLDSNQIILDSEKIEEVNVIENSSAFLNMNSMSSIDTVQKGVFTSDFFSTLSTNSQIKKLTTFTYYSMSFIRNSDGKFNIIFTPISEKINGVNSTSQTNLSINTSLQINTSNNYLITIANQTIYIKGSDITNGKVFTNIPINNDLKDEISIYVQKDSIIANDFSKQQTLDLGDCRNENHTTLEQNGIAYLYENQSVKVSAKTHQACLLFPFKLNKEIDKYSILLDYKNIRGDKPQICIYDETTSKCVVKESLLDANANNFSTVNYILNTRKEDSKFGLYIYTDAQNERAENIFDNLYVSGFVLQDKRNLINSVASDTQSQSTYSYNPLDQLTIENPLIDVIPVDNKSFEALIKYQDLVKDCNNVNKTNLSENMITGEQVNDSTDGQFGLKLSGINHIACINLSLGKLSEKYQYIFNIDFKSAAETITRVCIFNSSTQICEVNKVYDTNISWINKKITFTPNFDSNYEVYLYSYHTKGDANPYFTILDNLNLFQLPKDFIDSYLLVAKDKPQTNSYPDIKYTFISPTKLTVDVKNAVAPYFLNFSTTFSEGWQITSTENIQPLAHIKSNSYMNTWLIDKTGNYQLIIEFKNQKISDIATLISTIFSIVLIAYVVGSKIKPKKHKQTT
jgi:hypothetical protein